MNAAADAVGGMAAAADTFARTLSLPTFAARPSHPKRVSKVVRSAAKTEEGSLTAADQAAARESPYVWLIHRTPAEMERDGGVEAGSTPGSLATGTSSPSAPADSKSTTPAASAASSPAGSEPCGEMWHPLRPGDQYRLELAFRSAARLKDAPNTVVVDGGRAEVRLKERLFVDRYGADPPRESREVRRALWLRQDTKGYLEPYAEDFGQVLESTYENLMRMVQASDKKQNVSGDAQVVENVKIPQERGAKLAVLPQQLSRVVTLVLNPTPDPKTSGVNWLLTAEERPAPASSWLETAQTLFTGKSFIVKRGFGEVDADLGSAEEEALSTDVDRLIVVIHGIGEKLWCKDGTGLYATTGTLRKNVHQAQLRRAGFKQSYEGDKWEYSKKTANGDVAVVPKAEVLEASWWRALHNDEDDSRLQRITLPSMAQVRKLTNSVLVDGLFYFSGSKKREIMLEYVTNALNEAVGRFLTHHPDFSGPVFVAGHSLGGAILFDILRRSDPPNVSTLTFNPKALFALGSPIGIFLHCADDVPEPLYTLPNSARFFNIFHPQDPVAYRVEPLFAEEFGELPPEQVPAVGATVGGMKVHHGMKNLMRWATGEKGRAEESIKGVRLMLNGGLRVDWVLQDDVNMVNAMLGAAGEILQARGNHGGYFRSVDVGAFIESQSSMVMQEDIGLETRKVKAAGVSKTDDAGHKEASRPQEKSDATASSPTATSVAAFFEKDASGTASDVPAVQQAGSPRTTSSPVSATEAVAAPGSAEESTPADSTRSGVADVGPHEHQTASPEGSPGACDAADAEGEEKEECTQPAGASSETSAPVVAEEPPHRGGSQCSTSLPADEEQEPVCEDVPSEATVETGGGPS
eukprot:TRINITY_DN37810_c0_g1_i1.p1 TRINITY_DN37810_c0_g1~~TRINITY_DN37810_c0_g1_i1.p1  ORF type:complete len:864 (+),score=183.62 TRINITY_DN37810_c0_g1_i1:111-2702(+)